MIRHHDHFIDIFNIIATAIIITIFMTFTYSHISKVRILL